MPDRGAALMRTPKLAIASTMAVLLLGYLVIGRPDPLGYCLYAEFGLFGWTILGGFVGAAICATYLTWSRLPGLLHLTLIVAVAAASGVGYTVGRVGSGCLGLDDPPGRVAATAFGLGLIAATAGVIVGALVGLAARRIHG